MNSIFSNLDDLSRRSLLLHAAKATLGLSISANFLNGANQQPVQEKAPCKRVIFLYMRGGMSQTDTFDPKEKKDVGGKSNPLRTQSPDLLLSDKLPKLALQAKDLSVIRSMTTKTGAHWPGMSCTLVIAKGRGCLTHSLAHGLKCSSENPIPFSHPVS